MAQHASALARQALENAQQAEGADRDATRSNVEKATADLAAVRTALAHLKACRPRPEGWKKQVEAYDNDLETLEMDLAEVQETLDTGDFLAPSDLGGRLVDGASYLLGQIEESVRVSECR